jgi:hypothetical protein
MPPDKDTQWPEYEVYVCKCGDELNVYDIEPFSVSDVGAPRREETGNYYCEECEADYEPVKVLPISSIRERLTKNDAAAQLAIAWEEYAGGRAPGLVTRLCILEALFDAAFPDTKDDEP